MITAMKKCDKNLCAFILAGTMCVLLVAISYTAEARGGRGGVSAGGFSRSSPASSGSISARSAPAIAKRQGGDVGQPREARNAGGAGQPRAAQTASGASSARDAKGAGQTRRTAAAAPVTAQEMAAYRQQFAAQNRDGAGGDWDRRWHDNDDGDEDIERPVVPAVVVGAVIVAAARRADDYEDFVNTVEDPAYLAEDDCSLKATTEVNDVMYYRCSDSWYKRGYQSGSVVYIPTDPPQGY